MLAPLVLAALFAPVCHGQLVPPTPVEQAMEYRRMFGLPSGRAHVRRVQRTGARRDEQGFAFTRREWRYWDKRALIQDTASRVDGYIDRRPGLEGGMSIEDDWPRGPYLLVRVTRDPERHQAALRRIYPYRLRTTAVRYSGVELLELADRIAADEDVLAVEGFEVRGAGTDIERNRVVVHMVSARTDHEAYFQARYGPAVVTFATPEDTRLACRRIDGVRMSSTGRSLLLRWTYSSGEALETVELTEHADRVEVGIVQRTPFFGGPDDAHEGRTRVQLSQPLGNRRVIDAATGVRPSPAR